MEKQRTPGLSRRKLLVSGAATVGLAATGGWRLLAEPVAAQSKKGGAAATGRNPLYVPPTAAPTGTLTAAQTSVKLSEAHTSKTGMTYALSSLPAGQRTLGPTFVGTSGQTADITLDNKLGEDTTVHWHGMLVATGQDGQPHERVAHGQTRRYTFAVNQRAAFNWYHPHPHHMVSPQVSMGLAGGFIVRDAEDCGTTSSEFPIGAREVPLVIRDVQLDSAGNLQYKPNSNGYFGSLPLVNGTREPTLAVDRTWYRFRILAGAPARVFRLALSTGAPMRLIGNDGGLLVKAVDVTEIELGPGERADVLVDLTGLAANATVMLRDLAAGWDLLELKGTGLSVAYTPPANGAALSTITTLPGIPSQPTRTFSFDGMSRINGSVYDMHRIDFEVPFGVVERWRFTTGGNAPHPVHIHGGHFQVLSRSRGRGRTYPWEGGWKDTVLLHKGEIVDIAIRFDAFRGRYLMHCHQLEHEDSGMMMNFEVV